MTMHALIVEDDQVCQSSLAELIQRQGFETTAVASLRDARKYLFQHPTDLALVDLGLPDGDGLGLISEIDERTSAKVVVITGNNSVEKAVDAMRLGATDFLTKPLDVIKLKRILGDLAKGELRRPKMEPGPGRPSAEEGRLVSKSPAILEIFQMIDQVAQTDATVMIVGESGVGKDLIAQIIHDHSLRANAPYLPVNCGAISPNLVESELFGHERGSFTGAVRQHRGYFERADKGTLFLDEITEMPIELQVKLLRVLETGKIVRVGGNTPLEVDVRMIAATNRTPQEAVNEGKFRHDLFYRLNVFPIFLPPLRERPEDIEALSLHFLQQLNELYQTDKQLSAAALNTLLGYPWPGNVRELKNVIYRAYILTRESIEPNHIKLEPRDQQDSNLSCLSIKVGSSIAEAEKRLIKATLEATHWDKRKAAQVLGISLKTLYNRLNEFSNEARTI
jgi:DNA-binding NtrC family response regulator